MFDVIMLTQLLLKVRSFEFLPRIPAEVRTLCNTHVWIFQDVLPSVNKDGT